MQVYFHEIPDEIIDSVVNFVNAYSLLDFVSEAIFSATVFLISLLMMRCALDWGGKYTPCCWGFDTGTSIDITICWSSGELSLPLSLSPSLSLWHRVSYYTLCMADKLS